MSSISQKAVYLLQTGSSGYDYHSMIQSGLFRGEGPCLISFKKYQVPGFGPYISSVVLASIGNPLRFQNSSQVIRLAGYDLSASRSGKTSDKAIPEISKKGNAELRYALYQAALIGSTRNRNIMDYFTRKLKGRSREKGVGTKMRVKLAVKLLVIAWTLMKKKEPFNPEYLKDSCLVKQSGVSHLLEEKRAVASVRSRASVSSSRRDRRPLIANLSAG